MLAEIEELERERRGEPEGTEEEDMDVGAVLRVPPRHGRRPARGLTYRPDPVESYRPVEEEEATCFLAHIQEEEDVIQGDKRGKCMGEEGQYGTAKRRVQLGHRCPALASGPQ